MKGKTIKKLLIVTSAILILVTLALSLLHLPFVKQQILYSVQDDLRKNQGILLEVDTFDYNLFRFTLFLQGVRLNKSGPDPTLPFAEIESVRMGIPFSVVFSRKLGITDLEVMRPEINISIDRQGQTNLPDPALPGEVELSAADSPDIIVKRIAVENGLVRFSDERQNFEILIPGITAGGAWEGGNRHSFEAEARFPGSLSFMDNSFPLEKFALHGDISQEGIDIREFFVSSGAGSLLLAGSVMNFDSPVIDGSGKGRLDLAALNTLIDPKGKAVSGTIDFQSDFSGSLHDVSAHLQAGGKDIGFGNWENLLLDSEISWNEQMLEIHSLDIKDRIGQFHAKGTLHPFDWSKGNQLDMEWKGIEVAPFSEIFASPITFSSISSGAMEVSWNGSSLESITGQGEIYLNGKDGLEPSVRGIEISGKISAQSDSKGIRASFKDLSMPGARLYSDVLLNRDGIAGDFRMEVQSLAEIVPVFSAFSRDLDDRQIQELALDGPVSVNGMLAGSIDNPLVTIDVKSESLEFFGQENMGIEGSVTYDGQSVGIKALKVGDDKGKLRITGNYPLVSSGEGMRFEVDGDDLPLERILGFLNVEVDASGLVSVSSTVEGKRDYPEIHIKGIVAEGFLYGQTIEKLDFSGGYKDKKFVLENLAIRQEPGLLEAGGFYDPVKEEFKINVNSDSFSFGELYFPGFPEPVSGEVDIDMAASGTLDNPDIMATGMLSKVFIGNRDMGELPFEIQTRSDELAFSVESAIFSSSVEGAISRGDLRLLKLDLDTNLMELGVLKDRMGILAEQDFSGRMTSSLRINLDLENPGDSIEISADIEMLQFRTGQHLIQNKGPIRLSYMEDAFHVENLVLTGTGTEIEAKGSIDSRDPSGSRLRVDADVNLSMVREFFPEVESTGSLRIESEFRGSINDLDMFAGVEFSGTRFQYTPIPIVLENIQSSINIEDNVLHVNSLSLDLAESRLQMQGSVPLESLPLSLPEFFSVRGEREAAVAIRFRDFDPAVLKPMYPAAADVPVNGRISGTMDLKWDRLLPEKVSGIARFETLELNAYGLPLNQGDMSVFQIENGQLSIQNLNIRDGDDYLNLQGTVSLTGSGETDLSLAGEFDLGRMNALEKKDVYAGRARFELRSLGAYTDPAIEGFVDIQNGRIQSWNPRIIMDQLNGRMKFSKNRVDIEEMNGTLNGGKIVLAGDAGLNEMSLQDINLKMEAENAVLDFPEGLKSLVFGELLLSSAEKGFLLSGDVKVTDSRYTDDFDVSSSLSRFFRRDTAGDLLQENDSYLKNIQLDINILTSKNIIVDNNIAKSQLAADLVLTGTAYRPSLAGRMQIQDGGELYFNRNTFTISQGSVDFINTSRIEPEINLSAETEVQDYDIQLVLQGVPDKFTASLTSTPSLSEHNIVSLLVTGRTVESSSSSILSAAGDTALSFINSALTGKIETATARVLGLESVRIDSGLISTEENPGARITFGQHISRDFDLVYSQSLRDAPNRMWMTTYKPFRNFNIQGIKRDDNEYNLAFSHEFLFGSKKGVPGSKEDQNGGKEKLKGKLELTGNPGLPAEEVLGILKWKKGKTFSFSGLQDSLERVREHYRDKGYLSVALNSRSVPEDGRINLNLNIESGPQFILQYRGYDVPKKIKREIVDSWMGSSFGQLAREDMEQSIRIHLLEKDFYQASVLSREEQGENGDRIIVFDISTGPEYSKPTLNFEGNRMVPSSVISSYLQDNRLVTLAFYQPMEIKRRIEHFYGRSGFLRPEVQDPGIRFLPEEKKVYLDFSILEGARFRVGSIDIKGAGHFKEQKILKAGGIDPGEIITPEKYNLAAENIERLYQQEGFNDAIVKTDAQVDPEKGTVNLTISVEEGSGWIVEEIQVTGNLLTRRQVIRRELNLEKGDEVNFRTINESRKRLYDLGIFERVNINVVPMNEEASAAPESGMNPATAVKRCRILIDVRELKPYRLKYGLQYDTDSSFGIMASMVDRNFLGNAFLLGSSFRRNRDERDARAFFRSPHMWGTRINTELYLFNNEMYKDAFDVSRTGFTLQQQAKIGTSNIISYNYSFETIDTITAGQTDGSDLKETDQTGTLNFAVIRDTRDDILNASRGIFLSNDVRYAPGFMGSKTRYIRYFGQFNYYKKLNGLLTYASSLRVGLGKGYSNDLPASERFFAGGGTTIRGFKKDELGPRDSVTDLPIGGDAVLVLNQELRSRLYKRFGTAAFLDFGNVYPTISDFDPGDLRKTAGFGLRFQTPFVLIRLDWGFKLDRQPGESLSQIFFSIGQAF